MEGRLIRSCGDASSGVPKGAGERGEEVCHGNLGWMTDAETSEFGGVTKEKVGKAVEVLGLDIS